MTENVTFAVEVATTMPVLSVMVARSMPTSCPSNTNEVPVPVETDGASTLKMIVVALLSEVRSLLVARTAPFLFMHAIVVFFADGSVRVKLAESSSGTCAVAVAFDVHDFIRYSEYTCQH